MLARRFMASNDFVLTALFNPLYSRRLFARGSIASVFSCQGVALTLRPSLSSRFVSFSHRAFLRAAGPGRRALLPRLSRFTVSKGISTHGA